jgi:hypothetical protein
MKIQSLQYEDLNTGWKLDLIEFNPQLTLFLTTINRAFLQE